MREHGRASSRVRTWAAAGLLVLGSMGGVVTSAAAEEKLPAASEVIARHVAAVGGKDVILKHSSVRAKGTFSMASAGIEGTLEMVVAAPGRMVMRLNAPVMGDVQTGFDGTVGWSIDPIQGPAIMTEAQIDDIRSEADPQAELHYADRYDTLDVVGAVDFEGKRCFKLRLVTPKGRESFEFFDVETGLLAGREVTQAMAMGEIPVTAVVSEYKKIDGRLFPMKNEQKTFIGSQTIQITELTLNDAAAKEFELPEAIKALVAQEAAASGK